MSYSEGFETALELCISETEDAQTKQKALEKLKDLLALLKERKFEQIKRSLGVLSK